MAKTRAPPTTLYLSSARTSLTVGDARTSLMACHCVSENTSVSRVRGSTEPVVMLVDERLVQVDQQPLGGDVDRGPHVLVDGARREPEALAKEVEHAVASDEADHVVAAAFGLRERMLRRLLCFGKAQRLATGLNASSGVLPASLL